MPRSWVAVRLLRRAPCPRTTGDYRCPRRCLRPPPDGAQPLTYSPISTVWLLFWSLRSLGRLLVRQKDDVYVGQERRTASMRVGLVMRDGVFRAVSGRRMPNWRPDCLTRRALGPPVPVQVRRLVIGIEFLRVRRPRAAASRPDQSLPGAELVGRVHSAGLLPGTLGVAEAPRGAAHSSWPPEESLRQAQHSPAGPSGRPLAPVPAEAGALAGPALPTSVASRSQSQVNYGGVKDI
jgi:hypothetical protein